MRVMRAAPASSATCGSTRLVNHRWSTRLQCRGQRAIFSVDQPPHGLAQDRQCSQACCVFHHQVRRDTPNSPLS
jgi:hypothetical protein